MTPAQRPTVGALFNPSMSTFVERSLDHLEHLAFIPDRAWTDKGVGSHSRFQLLPDADRMMSSVARIKPVILHGIGLSICTAELFDTEYADYLADFASRLNSPWFSDHLSFSRVGTGHETNSALPLAVPYDNEVLDLLAPRVQRLMDRSGIPFLLENNVYYVKYPEEDMTEEQFFNRLCMRTGCGVLLDLHNLYTNAFNHGFSADDYVEALDLSNVLEIHVAGGIDMMGFHTDSHTGPVPEEVWTLLAKVAKMTPSLRGITFEFHESSYSMLGEQGLADQLNRAKAIVDNAFVAAGVP